MIERGSFIGYDAKGDPIAVAVYGEYGETRASARSFCSTAGLKPREFKHGDPELEVEITRWRDHALTLA